MQGRGMLRLFFLPTLKILLSPIVAHPESD